ncbi:M56 family metallopeptidase [Cytobacillus sp. IB215665]|uniref:M56 family metallopeptidase n=1 Tax=Cytobacillus sp. IB215665 TaxID=3097357 RepID=UPI002A109D36|nr:M56 family metallopeptidase [Cytobacillus sp. IB215665]MDX8367942.1 M56 family metallopeptidase [Cytobacillus sp. IB215665]
MDVQGLFSLVLSLSLLGSVMTGVIFLMKKGFHNKMSAHWHYYIWLLLIARLIIPYSFETSLLMPEKEPELSTSNSEEFEGTNNQISTIEKQESNNVIEEVSPVISRDKEKVVSIKSLKQILPIIWIAGATITLLIMLIVNFHFHWRLTKNEKCENYELLNLLEECKKKLKVKAKVQIIYDDSMGTPSVVGFFRPKILVNKNMLNSLSSNEIKFVLLHELTHVKRNDILIHWLIIFVQAIHWFNPIIWCSFYAMRKDCEISCDASVLSRLKREEHLEYGFSLLTVIEQISKKTLIPRSIGMSTSRSHMKLRLERITMFNKPSWKWISLSSMLAVGIILSGFTTFTNATSNHLIDTYETFSIEEEIISVAQGVQYDLKFSRVNKEVTITYYPILSEDPYTEEEFNTFKRDVQQSVEELLKSRNYNEYKVNVLADWVDSNGWNERWDKKFMLFEEIESQMEQDHNIEVTASISPSMLILKFYRDGELITNPEEVNYYHTEFIDLSIERGTSINFKEVTYFGMDELSEYWYKVVLAIDLGLKEIEELKVSSTTILTIDDPIIVNTDINSSDPKANEMEKKIKQLIQEFFEYKPISEKASGPVDVIVKHKEATSTDKNNNNNNAIYSQQELDELQKQVDEGHRSGLLDPEQVAREFLDMMNHIKVDENTDSKLIVDEETKKIIQYRLLDGRSIQLELIQPSKKGVGGIFVVSHFIFVDPISNPLPQLSNSPLFIDLRSNEYVDKKDLELIKAKIMNFKLQNGEYIYEIFNDKFSKPTWIIASLDSTVIHFTGFYNGNEYKIDFNRWSPRWLNISIDDEEIHEDEVSDYFDNLVKQLTKQ